MEYFQFSRLYEFVVVLIRAQVHCWNCEMRTSDTAVYFRSYAFFVPNYIYATWLTYIYYNFMHLSSVSIPI